MAGKAERLERRELRAPLGKPHQRRGVVGQIGPGMHDVERAGIGQALPRHLLADHKVEPGAEPAAVEVSGAQHDRAHAAVGRFLDALLDLDPHRALARGRMHRRALVEHRRHAAAVVPDAAGKQQRRAVAFRRRDRAIGERQRVLLPKRDVRIERVEHHVAAARRLHRLVAGHGLDRLDAARDLRLAARPHQALHGPAGVAERLRCRNAQPSGGAENEDLLAHAEAGEARGLTLGVRATGLTRLIMQLLLLALTRPI